MSGPDAPIGIFDSGVGGLSVLREVRAELPHEDLLYIADSAHAPYGDKPAAAIEARASAVAAYLAAQGVKALVVACNTATGVAVAALRRQFTMPIIGIEPAIKPAASLTTSGVVGVLATSQTLASEKFDRLAETFEGRVRILRQPCPGLVEQIESGDLSSAETRTLVERVVSPLVAQGADTLVLGCTHYPFVAGVIQSVAGPGVRLIDPARAVAKEVRRRLDAAALLSSRPGGGGVRILVNGTASGPRSFAARCGIDAGEVREVAL